MDSPVRTAARLRQIAFKIDASENPSRKLVAADLKRVIVAIENPCYPCRGNGDIKGKTCPYCKGRGVSGDSTWDGEDDSEPESGGDQQQTAVTKSMDGDQERRKDWITKWFEQSKTPPEDQLGLIKWITKEDVGLDALDDEAIDVLYAKLRDEEDMEPLPVECNADEGHPCDADVDKNGEKTGCPACREHAEEMHAWYKGLRPDQHEEMRMQTDPEYAHQRQQELDEELRDAGRK